jgi:hypothetical protein
MFLFVNQILAIVFAHFSIRDQLNGVSRAGFFAKAAEDASRKIDPEKFGITPAVFVFGSLKRNAVHRAGSGAKITGHAPFVHIRIPGQHNPSPVTGRQIWFYLGILHRFRLVEEVKESQPDCLKYTEHNPCFSSLNVILQISGSLL